MQPIDNAAQATDWQDGAGLFSEEILPVLRATIDSVGFLSLLILDFCGQFTGRNEIPNFMDTLL